VAVVTKLFGEAEIARRVDELAVEIAGLVHGEFTVLGILKGSFVFVADLVRALDRAGLQPRIEFIQLSSYGHAKESSGAVRLVGSMPPDMATGPVLVVDDIADTGRSLAYAKHLLEQRGATRVWTCALGDKPSRREVDFSADFVGFTIDDRFVVGYGIDHAEKYRYLPYIGTID
jgi:hypoxanthine phosphoribosyltransferase